MEKTLKTRSDDLIGETWSVNCCVGRCTIASVFWLAPWHCALRCSVNSCLLSDQTSFQMLQEFVDTSIATIPLNRRTGWCLKKEVGYKWVFVFMFPKYQQHRFCHTTSMCNPTHTNITITRQPPYLTYRFWVWMTEETVSWQSPYTRYVTEIRRGNLCFKD